MIDKATVKRIIDVADIVEVVGDYVHLVKRGSNYMGLCPFHNEKTPSFSVNRQRNICKCFSCGKGGSPVNFIMEKEGVNYHDALLHLAKKYGIKVEERELTDEEREQQSERESMLVVNEWAMRQMESNLTESEEGKTIGLQYLYQRGITNEAIAKFHLGYAIDKGQDLYDKAIKSGYDVKHLKSVGLCGESQQGRYYDRFRGRVIFPVHNPAGKVIAFGGRGIKGEPAKYINSPESQIYVKSNELYGIYQAKTSIIRQNKCYLVEGYMDVIGMWQSGMENVVASSGTSLTDGQIALIHRFTENVTLIYDGDAAGIKASIRGIDLLLSHNLNVKVLLLPDGEDPDSFSRNHTPEEFREYIENNETDFIRFKTQTLLEGCGNDPIKRAEAIRSIVKSLSSISDMIKRSMYVQDCSRLLNVSENILILEVKKARGEVVEEQRKKIERSSASTDSAEASIYESMASKKAATDKEDTTFCSILRPLEKNVITYCVRYGMSDYAATDADGEIVYLKVFQVIADEMSLDNLTFTTPVYERIFQRINDMYSEYFAQRGEFRQELDAEVQKRYRAGLDKIASEQLSVEDIAHKEDLLKRELDVFCSSRESEFDKLYVSKILSSDPDDELRNEVLNLITEKYNLSKYHFKTTKIEVESDKLSELIPRVIDEWKDGVLHVKIEQARAELKRITAENTGEDIVPIMAQIQRLAQARQQFAKQIGERIIVPKK